MNGRGGWGEGAGEGQTNDESDAQGFKWCEEYSR